jgi:enoyl-CoA hydratase/carnithine racemase
MSSDRKVEASRTNGRTRKRPKTAEGKMRSSRNARRHGLNLPVLADPVLSKRAEELAREIAGSADPTILRHARAVAEAQIDLVRIRRARHHLLAQNTVCSTATPADAPPSDISA